jgi:hypothetical protein
MSRELQRKPHPTSDCRAARSGELGPQGKLRAIAEAIERTRPAGSDVIMRLAAAA